MNMRYEQLAHRYAVAFLNIFGAQVSREDAEHIYEARKLLETNHELVFVLSVPILSQHKKDELVDIVFKKYALPNVLKKLVNLLFVQKRIGLLAIVFRHVWWLYLARNDMMHLYVESSCELTATQKESLEEFMTYKLPKTTGVYTYKVKDELIAGVRIHSATILWDNSLRSKLTTLKHLLPS